MNDYLLGLLNTLEKLRDEKRNIERQAAPITYKDKCRINDLKLQIKNIIEHITIFG